MKVIIPCFIVVENAESVDDADNQAVFLAESINSTLRDAADNDCSVYLDERLPSWVAGDSEVVDCASPHAFDACQRLIDACNASGGKFGRINRSDMDIAHAHARHALNIKD